MGCFAYAQHDSIPKRRHAHVTLKQSEESQPAISKKPWHATLACLYGVDCVTLAFRFPIVTLNEVKSLYCVISKKPWDASVASLSQRDSMSQAQVSSCHSERSEESRTIYQQMSWDASHSLSMTG